MALVTKQYRFTVGLLLAITLIGFLPQSVFSAELSEEAKTDADGSEAITEPRGYNLETIRTFGDSEGDFVVGPGKTELAIEPGQTRQTEILVTNRMGERKTFQLEVEDFVGSSDPNQTIVLLGDQRGPYSLKDYVQLPITQFDLEHGQRARIPVTISVPEDAEPGGMYGSVLVSTVTRDAVRGDTGGAAPQSALITRVGTLFFITVPGDVDTGGRLTKFATIPDKSWFDKGPIHFELLYENAGSIHLNPYGELRVTNILGEEVGFVEIDPWFALPGSLRYREVIWNRDLLFGRYTATAYINRGYEDIIDTMEVSFWVVPWKLALGVFVGLFIFFYLIRTFFKRFEFSLRPKGPSQEV